MNNLNELSTDQLNQYNELCEEYPKYYVDLFLSLYGPNELFDGIVMDLEELYNY